MRQISTSKLALLLLMVAVPAFGQSGKPRDYILPSWGDIVLCYGPGVDPALDSPVAFEHMVKHWQGRGFRGIFLRTDLKQLAPDSIRRNPLSAQDPVMARALAYIDTVADRFDVHKVGNEISERNGFEFWAWHAHTFSDGAPETAGADGPGRIWPWSYVSMYTYKHPEALTTDRTQKKHQWMVREYGYPEARATKIAEFVYMAKELGLRRFEVENRSEASQMQDPPDNADRFGFNDIVVKDMQRRYGVDILTDPRFDVDNPRFNSLDSMVEHWHQLRGEYFTQFFRELRKGLNEVDPKIQIAASLAGERIGPPMGNWFTDWRTWVDEGLIDAIVTPCNFDAWPTSADILKTYITCAKQGRDIPLKEIHDYVKASKHPNVKIISSGSFFYPNPPTNGDAWRTTDWYDSYQMAWYQRWGQLMKDLDEFGYIKFFDQNFDNFPINGTYYSGAYGNPTYVPAVRACPGLWYRMGDGTGTLPSIQSKVHYGSHGTAAKLISDSTKPSELIAAHESVPDRSTYYSCIEPGILNGRVELEFKILRQSDDSGATVHFQNRRDVKPDIGIRVAGGTGELFYSRSGSWQATGVVLPKGIWQQLRITVDFTKASYSASVVTDGDKAVCGNVPYLPASPRIIPSDDGSGKMVQLKSYKMLNQLDFMAEGKTGAVTYLDDVIARWTPVIPYEKTGRLVLFAEDFERYAPGEQALKEKPQVGATWTLKHGDATQAVIENSVSYGEGVHSLRIRGNAELLCENAAQSAMQKTVLDVDVFVRSNAFYVNMMPNNPAQAKQVLNVALTDGHGTDLAGIKNEDGQWSYLDEGTYKKSSVPAALDCWTHIQIDLDAAKHAYKIVIQPVGEMPAVLAESKMPDSSQTAQAPSLVIRTTALDDVFQTQRGDALTLMNCSCVDNIRLSAN